MPEQTDMPARDWPELHYDAWRDTCSTLHLWTQVVGKIRLSLTPWQNHSWHVPLYVTAKGLTTSPIPYGSRAFSIEFDFNRHVLNIEASDGSARQLPLQPQSVADFHAGVMQALAELGIVVSIDKRPCEIAGAIAFDEDVAHAAYAAEHANRFWRALVHADRVFKQFRTGFLGKCSPVHFFWGSFDLAVTRFSGRTAPRFSGKAPGVADAVMQEAYSHEVSSAGFWPGGNGTDASFYSYAYPRPQGYAQAPVRPREAGFSEALGEFLLPYEAVRSATDPVATLLGFLESTYEAAARTGNWDRAALECAPGAPGVCRALAP
ncbi:MAG TPA: DUF5996 family protein [Burkholderiales bacterium]|nr:DUF5996 family protein [Burkholderiales bacterium]